MRRGETGLILLVLLWQSDALTDAKWRSLASMAKLYPCQV